MIIRVSEAFVRSSELDNFLSALHDLVADFPARHPGLIGHEVLVDLEDSCRVQYVSRWRDENALISFAGVSWRTDPITFPGESTMLLQPLIVRHFIPAEPILIG